MYNTNCKSLILLTQNEIMGTDHIKSLTCTPRNSQSQGATSDTSTINVRMLSLFRILRILIIISPSTRCSSSWAIIWAKMARINNEAARSTVKRTEAYSCTLRELKVDTTWSKRYGVKATRMRSTMLRNVMRRVSIGRTDMSLV